MRDELGTTGAVVGMVVLTSLFGGLALAIYPGWAAIGAWLDRVDAPAWVQAVGSIAAIFAAVLISVFQQRRQERIRRQELLDIERTRLQALLVELSEMEYTIMMAASSYDGFLPTRDVLLNALRNSLQRAQRYHLFDFPRSELVQPFAELTSAIKVIIDTLDPPERDMPPMHPDNAYDFVNEKWHAAERAVLLCRRLLGEDVSAEEARQKAFVTIYSKPMR
ncbi:hypothetical protein LJR084_001205 [Variovorax sp. LjRoot84]|uniref:hypothetical protein n=1 Tax=Variovorax sp. LjRoot84 TaxID=3342340 RepID=UPI003ED174A1